MVKKSIDFKGEPLRETVVKALEFIGVDVDDFVLKTEYFSVPNIRNHDQGHLYRVMLDCALIALKVDEKRKGLLAFCGAFIHDLAKHSSGDSEEHGPRAAEQKWDMFNHIWEKYNLTEEERNIVRAAVCRHSRGRNNYAHEDSVVNNILHDADAFDRARFRHKNDRLNWNYLNHPDLKVQHGHVGRMTKILIGETEAVWCFTKDANPNTSFREYISNIR